MPRDLAQFIAEELFDTNLSAIGAIADMIRPILSKWEHEGHEGRSQDRCQKFPWCVIAPDGHPGECSSIPYKLWAHSKECPDCKSTDRNKLLDPCVFEGHKTHPWHKEEREKILNQLAGHEGRSSSPAPRFCIICGVREDATTPAALCVGKVFSSSRHQFIERSEGAPLPAPSTDPILALHCSCGRKFAAICEACNEIDGIHVCTPVQGKCLRDEPLPVEPEIIRQWRDPKVAWLSPWHEEILAYIDGLKGKPPSPSSSGMSLDRLVELLTELRTYYMERDDPNAANWCMKVINEAKETL